MKPPDDIAPTETPDGFDEHLVCPAWPNCDVNPLGCHLIYWNEVEEYGYKD
jgi:hypothetical protein